MTSGVLAQYDFLSAVRRGAAADLDPAQPDPLTGSMPARGALKVKTRITASGPAGAHDDPVEASFAVYGPGDVIGVDPRHIVRNEPADGTPNFEPNYLAGIEFDHPDFPWLFTPAATTTTDRLRPWLVLVVLADEEWTVPADAPPDPLPAIEVASAANLPPLADSWAFAHAQVSGGLNGANLGDVVASAPQRVLSRILCPRQLDAGKHYTAFLVPSFEHGRLAGLGEDVSGTTTDVAWHGTETQRRLPVYHRFQFTTSEAGDFVSLARGLTPRVLGPEVGVRPMDVSDPGWGLPDAGDPLALSGALRSVSAVDTTWHNPERSNFRSQLADDINLGDTSAGGDPKIVPPLYGRWHAARSQVHPGTSGWVHELNLDPRFRAIAGLGTRVVLDQRIQLLASAWKQVSGLREANQILRQGQLSRGTARRIYETSFEDADGPGGDAGAARVVALTGSLHGRVLDGDTTVAGTVSGSALPPSALSGAFSRLVRPSGPLRRRQGAGAADNAALLSGLAAGDYQPSPNPRPGGLKNIDDVADEVGVGPGPGPGLFGWVLPWWWWLALVLLLAVAVVLAVTVSVVVGLIVLVVGLIVLAVLALRFGHRIGGPGPPLGARPGLHVGDLTPGSVAGSRPRPGFSVSAPGQPFPPQDTPDPNGTDSTQAGLFRGAAEKIAAALDAAAQDEAATPVAQPVDLGAIATTLLNALDPELTVPERLSARVEVDASQNWDPDDPIEPIMAAPEFPQPMYAPLRDLSQDLLLPGLDKVPHNTLALLQENRAFLESYMVGLNHEMARQLLWNEYPTDQRGTYFRQFWDVAGYVPLPTDPTDPDELRQKLRDIPLIPFWSHSAEVGDHPNRTDVTENTLILLIRGELLRRYPTAVIYACEAEKTSGVRVLGTAEKYPLFRGTLSPDVTFLGFDLDPATARGDGGGEGWFFVFQQQPSEPRFGLEPIPASGSAPAVSAWNDVTWANVGSPKFMPAGAALQQATGLTWPGESATLASVLLRRPVRVGIHAEMMLPPDA